ALRALPKHPRCQSGAADLGAFAIEIDCIAALQRDFDRRRVSSRQQEAAMFSVLFEVQPKRDRWDLYLEYAKLLKPELEAIDGFVDNIRYRSLTREGWLLSLSNWRDEKSLVRWRTQAKHHAVQQKGRTEVFLDYHLRVGQLTHDTGLPEGQFLHEQRLDATEAGAATTVTLLDAERPAARVAASQPIELAAGLGLRSEASGLIAWDVFEAVLTPGAVISLMS